MALKDSLFFFRDIWNTLREYLKTLNFPCIGESLKFTESVGYDARGWNEAYGILGGLSFA